MTETMMMTKEDVEVVVAEALTTREDLSVNSAFLSNVNFMFTMHVFPFIFLNFTNNFDTFFVHPI